MTDCNDVIDKIAGACYSNKENEAKKLFNEFINTISIEGENQNLLYQVLKNMLLALENNDLVMVADILLYELKPLLNGEPVSTDLLGFSAETLPIVDMDLLSISFLTGCLPFVRQTFSKLANNSSLVCWRLKLNDRPALLRPLFQLPNLSATASLLNVPCSL